MTDTKARTLLLSLLAALAFALLAQPFSETRGTTSPTLPPERVVYLAGELSPEKFLALTATLEASPQSGTLLLYSPRTVPILRTYLQEQRVERVVPIGDFPEGVVELERKLAVAFAPPISWLNDRPNQLWDRLIPTAECVVVCPAEPRSQLLHAACLAGASRAPLFVVTGRSAERDELRRRLERWQTSEVVAIGEAMLGVDLGDRRVVRLTGEQQIAARYLDRLTGEQPIETIVTANPADSKMSLLAPWVALQRRAALVLTQPKGNNVEEAVRSVLGDRRLREADALILVADLEAIPMLLRPNPIPGDKDKEIEMEPFTPHGQEPYTFATGRLFHPDRAVVPLVLARQRQLAKTGLQRVLAASNAGGGLPMLELFTRSTMNEFRNAGLDATALYGNDVHPDLLRRLMPRNDLFLYEGHHNCLMLDWKMPEWDEQLPPSLVFLQTCLGLSEWKLHPLFDRGAVGIIGAPNRIYSGTGGACSLAFFDALLYEQQSIGGSLRHAKNFLSSVAVLKEKRLGEEAKRTGANHRSAWAFTLWGDPTLKLPKRELPAKALPPVRHEVHGNTLTLKIPEERHARVTTSKYQARIAPNVRLSGLVRRDPDAETELVPVLFAEVPLPHAPSGYSPKLTSRVPSSRWVFTWDARRRTGYLLVSPREKDQDEILFHIGWTATAEHEPTAAGGQ